MKIYKLNTIFSVSNILIFIIEFLIISLADFSKNLGTSKDVALFSFTFLYIWYTFPSILTLFLTRYRKKHQLVDVPLFIINVVIFILCFPMFLAYIRSVV